VPLFFLIPNTRQLGFKRGGSDSLAFEIDAVLREDHRFRTRVTTKPVEDGSDMNDHIFNEPPEVTVDYLISNSPIVTVFSATGDDKVQNVIDILRDIRDSRELLTLASGLQVYENMIITRLMIPIRQSLGQALRIRATLRGVTKVATEAIIQASNTSDEQAMPTQNVGTQTPSIIEPF